MRQWMTQIHSELLASKLNLYRKYYFINRFISLMRGNNNLSSDNETSTAFCMSD
jgi:hypothetical protein